jgi:uncharacterized protein (TIGR03067 family)
MSRYFVAVALVAALGAGQLAAGDAEKLHGTWNLTAIEVKGMKKDAPEGSATFIFMKDGKLQMKGKGKDQEGTYTADASKKPMQIDLTGPQKDGKDKETMKAIYQIDGDTLKLAYSLEGPKGDRPTAFDGEKAFIMVFKRGK